MLQRPVSQDSFVPEIPICQSPHRPVRPAVGAYIGIAGRPAITKIDIFALGAAATAINCAGRPKRSVSMAIRTFDLFLLRHKNHHLQMRIDDGAKASFSVKSYTNCSPGPEKAVWAYRRKGPVCAIRCIWKRRRQRRAGTKWRCTQTNPQFLRIVFGCPRPGAA